MPAGDFSAKMLESTWVTLVIEDGKFLDKVRPLTDRAAIDIREGYN